jgi:hypothetical protein
VTAGVTPKAGERTSDTVWDLTEIALSATVGGVPGHAASHSRSANCCPSLARQRAANALLHGRLPHTSAWAADRIMHAHHDTL